MDIYKVLELMTLPGHSGYSGFRRFKTPRRLIREGDWEDKPPAPPKPNEEDAYKWHDKEAMERYRRAYWILQDHNYLWPIIPRKTFRRLVSRGYIEREGNAWGITEEGRQALKATKQHLEWWRKAKYRYYSRCYSSTRPNRKTAMGWVKMWNDKGYGKEGLRRAAKRFNLTANDIIRIKREFYYLSHPREDEDAAPPPARKPHKRNGWGERITQRHLDRKYAMIEDEL